MTIPNSFELVSPKLQVLVSLNSSCLRELTKLWNVKSDDVEMEENRHEFPEKQKLFGETHKTLFTKLLNRSVEKFSMKTHLELSFKYLRKSTIASKLHKANICSIASFHYTVLSGSFSTQFQRYRWRALMLRGKKKKLAISHRQLLHHNFFEEHKTFKWTWAQGWMPFVT